MSERKRMFRFFTIADFEQEEEFLREQHKRGYKLVKYTPPACYVFEKCEPEDVIYQLDFSDVSERDKASYLQLFRDNGWEYLFDAVGWSYFRKPADADDGDLSIFSDIESRLDMLKRVQKRRLLPLIVIFLCCILPQLYRYGDEVYRDAVGGQVIFGMFVVLFLLYLYIFIRYGISLMKLKKKYGC